MVNKIKYTVPIFRENEDTWNRVNGITSRISCLYDGSGHLSNCDFEFVKSESLGEFYVFRSVDRTVAETVAEQLQKDTSLKVLPTRSVIIR